MTFDYGTVVDFAKSWGLFYLLAFGAAVTLYTFWPANRKTFDAAKKSIIQDDEADR
jgi:cytochrome c oxidase cbb3-type subunit 4